MAVVALMSHRGAPGVTTAALAIAAAWPVQAGRRKVLIEADPAGGVMALRYGIGVEPGLVTLAAAMRAEPSADTLWAHTQQLPGGLDVVVAPDSPGATDAALNHAGRRLIRWLAELDDVDVIIDLGRATADSATPFLTGATAVLVVARPDAEQLVPTAHRIGSLNRGDVAWLLIGDRPYTADDVTKAYGFPVAGVIADDRRGVAAMETGAGGSSLKRSLLARSAGHVATSLASALSPSLVPPTEPAATQPAPDPAEDAP